MTGRVGGSTNRLACVDAPMVQRGQAAPYLTREYGGLGRSDQRGTERRGIAFALLGVWSPARARAHRGRLAPLPRLPRSECAPRSAACRRLDHRRRTLLSFGGGRPSHRLRLKPKFSRPTFVYVTVRVPVRAAWRPTVSQRTRTVTNLPASRPRSAGRAALILLNARGLRTTECRCPGSRIERPERVPTRRRGCARAMFPPAQRSRRVRQLYVRLERSRVWLLAGSIILFRLPSIEAEPVVAVPKPSA
jgi:hypothetical protein